MINTIRLAVFFGFSLWLAAPASAQSCGPVSGLEFVCGPKNAEDLVRVPGTPWIIASSMTEGASLTLIDSRNGAYSTVRQQAKPDATFAGCATAPDAAKAITHGLNLRAGANGHSTLYAVGHGSREAIEVFDVNATGANPAITWKGCVPMPDGLAANSVASFKDGSLVATVLLMPGKTFADSVAKKPTGAVYEWAPGRHGFEQIRGSELPGNNGIEVSADGKEIFVVSSGLQTIVAFAHANPTKQLRTTRPLPFTPDNVHMGEDGRLLTAGMKNDVPECGGPPARSTRSRSSRPARAASWPSRSSRTPCRTRWSPKAPRSPPSATPRWCSRSTGNSGSERFRATGSRTGNCADRWA